jgi:hypothetical protein
MFGRKARIKYLEQELKWYKGKLSIADIRLAQMRNTIIRVSVPTPLGVRPVYDVELEYAIMLTNMMKGAEPGYKVEGMHVEVISEYTPLYIPDRGDEDYVNDRFTGDEATNNGDESDAGLPSI